MKLHNLRSLSGRLTGIILSLCLVVLLGAASAARAQGPGESLLYQQDFEQGVPPGWEFGPGWEVRSDNGNAALVGSGHVWARPAPGLSYTGDFRVQLRLMLIRGGIHLNYRTNVDGRYFFGFNPEGAYLNKQYWPDTFIDLARVDTSHSLSTWHTITIAGEGGRLQFVVDGVVELDFTDPDPLLVGSFAFESLDDSLVYIDDIAVYGPAVAEQPALDVSWVRTGGPLGGLGYDIRIRPDNPDRMYVTDAWAGVFTSTDGGHTWEPSNTGITTRTGESGDAIPVFCLTIDPHDYDTIWVGTQNIRGIFKSTDGGQTWVEKDNGIVEQFGITFRGFAVDPRTSDTVYAAAEIASWAWAGEERQGREFDMTRGVVYRTTDGGENWAAIWRGDNLARYIWIDPRDSNIIYVSTGIFDREAANSDPTAGTPGGVGIIKSTDGGSTWEQADNGLGNLYTGTLFMHPENPDILLVGTGNNQYYQENGVYLSTDGGQSWQRTLRDDNIESVEFSLSNPAIAYAGSSDAIYRSEDGGQSWQLVSSEGDREQGWGSPGVRAGFPIDFQVDPRNPDRIFANNYGGGNFLSEDGGRTWEVASSGYTGAQVRAIAADPVDPARVYAAARSGLFMTADGGTSWIGLNTPPARAMEWNAVAIDPSMSDHVLASNNWNGTLLESFEGGQAWHMVSQPAGPGKGWRVIAFAPSDPRTVYAGMSAFYSAGTFSDTMAAGGVYVSHDRGARWQPANSGPMQDANVTGLAIAPDDPQTVYAATGNRGLLRSTDGGQTWEALSLGLRTQPPLLSVAVHPTAPDTLFVGLMFGGLYRSDDGGQTWRIAGMGLSPEAAVSSIIFDPTAPDVMVVADRLSGVYRSTNGGESWHAISNGLMIRHTNALAFSPDGQHLYAATEGGGVFRLDLNNTAP